MIATANILAILAIIFLLLDMIRRMSWRRHPAALGGFVGVSWIYFSELVHFATDRDVALWMVFANVVVLIAVGTAYDHIHRTGGFCVR